MTGAGNEDKERLDKVGELLGMAFQIRDDIFDYYRSDVGKPTGNDLREGKVTLPLLYALSTVQGEAEETELLQLLSERPITETAVARLTDFALSHGGITYAEERLLDYIHEAKQLLNLYPDSPYRTSLLALADYIGERNI